MPSNTTTIIEKQKDQLDRLLLSATSLIGIILAVTQSVINKDELLIFFIFLFIFVWFFPIYVGYIRGAIIHNNIVERFRGWAYLVGGILIYIFYSNQFFNVGQNFNFFPWGLLKIILFFIITYGLIFYLKRKFFQFFKYTLSEADKIVLKRTYINLLLIVVAYAMYLTISGLIKDSATVNEIVSIPMLVGFSFMSFIIILILISEYRNNKILGKKIRKIPKKGIDISKILLSVSLTCCIILLLLITFITPEFIIPGLQFIVVLMYITLAILYLFILSMGENYKIEIEE